MISDRQKIKRKIYTELLKIPLNKDKIRELNKELEEYPPNITEPYRYNFKRKEYERKSIPSL